MPRIFYPSVFNPPGQFTTTNNAPQGGECHAPLAARGPIRQQSQGVFLSPGNYAAAVDNTQFGGEAFAPTATHWPTARGSLRGPPRQQPDGLTLPPGNFVFVAVPPVPAGWKIIFPTVTRRTNDVHRREIPSGDNSGWLRPPPDPPGPRVISGRIVPRVPIRLQTTGGQQGGQSGQAGQGGGGGQTRYDADGSKFPQKIDPRAVRFTEIVEMILNSLIGNGSIYKTGAGEWAIAFIPRETPWSEAFLGELFWDVSTGTLSYKEIDGTIHHYTSGSWSSLPDPKSSIYPVFAPAGIDDEFDNASFAGWTTVNDGTAIPTVTEANDVASILLPGGGTAARLYAYMKATTVSAGDIIEMAFRGYGLNQNFNICGLIMADGVTYNAGAQLTWYLSPTETSIRRNPFTGYNAQVGATSYAMQGVQPTTDCFLRLKYEGANNWSGYCSADGISWVNLTGTFSRVLTPTHVGFFATTWGGVAPFNWSVRYFRKIP